MRAMMFPSASLTLAISLPPTFADLAVINN
jgi:hypothetical protein